MDSHVFRRLCDELAPALMGCRIEKIHRPAKDVTLFTLYGTGGKRFLFIRAGRKAPFLFLSTHKIPVGSAPPADIMRLRKYLADRRIIDVLPDWVGRRLFLRVNADAECWLTLDLREGPSLRFDAPPEPETPAWPDPARWADACAGEGWRTWAVLLALALSTLLNVLYFLYTTLLLWVPEAGEKRDRRLKWAAVPGLVFAALNIAVGLRSYGLMDLFRQGMDLFCQ